MNISWWGGYHGGQDWVMGTHPHPPHLAVQVGSAPFPSLALPQRPQVTARSAPNPGVEPRPCDPAALTFALSDCPLLLAANRRTRRLGAAKSSLIFQLLLGLEEHLCRLHLCVLGLESLEGDNIIRTVPSVAHRGSRLGGRGVLQLEVQNQPVPARRKYHPVLGRHFLVCTKSHQHWYLQYPGHQLVPV